MKLAIDNSGFQCYNGVDRQEQESDAIHYEWKDELERLLAEGITSRPDDVWLHLDLTDLGISVENGESFSIEWDMTNDQLPDTLKAHLHEALSNAYQNPEEYPVQVIRNMPMIATRAKPGDAE